MTTQADTKKTYVLDGTLLEACSCGGPCPCWVGDDPEGGRCDSINAYHIDRGHVGGVDVSPRNKKPSSMPFKSNSTSKHND